MATIEEICASSRDRWELIKTKGPDTEFANQIVSVMKQIEPSKWPKWAQTEEFKTWWEATAPTCDCMLTPTQKKQQRLKAFLASRRQK